SDTGAISGTPTTAGTYTFTVKASNSGGEATKTFTLTVVQVITAPVITTESLPSATAGKAYSAAITATGDNITWTVSGLPSGLTFDSGTISGTPAVSGIYTVTAAARNSAGADSKSFTLTVFDIAKPVVIDTDIKITTESLPDGKAGEAYSAGIETSGAKAGYNVVWLIIGLPEGMSYSNNGITAKLSGTPKTAGSFTVKVAVSDTQTEYSRDFTLKIADGDSDNEKIHNGHRYRIYPDGMTWSEAKAYCESLGGHLVTIASQEEQNVVASLVLSGDKNSYWLGGQKNDNDAWSWIDGSAWDYTHWAAGQPDFAYENKLMMYRLSNPAKPSEPGTWNNLIDAGTFNTETFFGTANFGFVCEWDNVISSDPVPVPVSPDIPTPVSPDPAPVGLISPVIITGAPLGAFDLSDSVSIQLEATGTPTITWMRTDGTLPAGTELSSSGVLSGTLTAAGTYTFLVSATNAAGSVSRRFTLIVNNPSIAITAPEIVTSPDLGAVKAGDNVSVQIRATGTAPLTWLADNLPEGLNMSSAGLVYGTIMTADEYDFTVTVSNSAGNDSRTFTLNVEDAAIAPTITTPQDLGAVSTEESVQVQFEATGTEPITWTATGLPSWLELDNDGLLTGTAPENPGIFTFSVTARNSKGTDSRKFTLRVRKNVLAAIAPTITTASLSDGEMGVIYSAMFEATGTDPITWSATGLPDGFTLNATSGKLSGVPKTGGTFTLTVTAANSAGKDTKEYTLTIAEKIKVSPPKITTVNLPEATEGQPYTFKLEAEGEKLTWSATSKTMTWFTFTNDGTLSGTPDVAGTYNLTVKVRNTAGADYANFTLKVKSSGGDLKVPEVKTTRLPDACKDEEYRCFLEGEGENLTWALAADKGDGLPRGLTLDEDGLISGLVRESTVGTFRFRVTATNSAGTSPVKTVSIKVTGKAPEFTTETLKAAKWNKKYSFALKVRNMKPTAWSIEGELPEGIKFDKGKFTGKATEVDEYNLTITASNGAVTLTDDFTLTVQGVTPKIKGSFKKGTEGQQYTSVLKAKGVTPITWDFEDLPAGLDYTTDATGEVCTISGVPEKAFSDKIKVTIETGDEQTYGKNLKMTIKAVKPKITVDDVIPDAVVGERFRYQLKMTPENAEVVWSYTGDMPYGLTLDEDTGLIYGMPLDEVEKMKVYTFVVTAENASKRSSKSRVTISLRVYPSGTVLPVNTADPSEDSKPEFVNGV
ncbi:MAG: putative Ig domain-containing protein, partial [Synergistaceae bacterium]|nr:putative Ig domain-containing protein [Synergistaceae bacterium]